MSPQRRATRTYNAKRRNGHYTTPPGRVPTPSRQSKYNAVPLHQVKRKLQFGRSPPKARSTIVSEEAQSKGKKSSKTNSKSTTSPRKEGRCKQMSRELLKLLDMANCMFPWRLRSSTKVWSHCHGDQAQSSLGYPLHHSPEQLRLNILRGQ